MLKVENLVKKYRKFLAVDNISFEVNAGEIYGFVGANGAGKTTTMMIACGLLGATSGAVYINGVDVAKSPRLAKKHIGYMPDFFGVYDDLKVSEYMNFYCGLHEIPINERQAIIDSLLELVNLSNKKEFYVDHLSRGMKQRLCLARSLVHDPSLLILDEPASGLDPRARVEMREVLMDLKDMGKTVIISSHILSELAEICTSIGIIHNGKMVSSGSVMDIQNQMKHLSKIKVKALTDVALIRTFLKEQPLVSQVVLANGLVEFSFSGNDEDKYMLLQQLLENGIKVIHFEEAGGSLESIFMHITEEGGEASD
jgi:ABC-2 type transport system ATP-binding protein